jgi:hypothetical protein
MSDSNSIQSQWNVLETAILAKDSMVAILRACAEEDVQGQAVLALEGLGFGLEIDERRREAGLKALKTWQARVVHQLRLFIGLSRGGLAMHMSQSQNLIASFLIICACKICYEDEQTALILYELMKLRGIYDRVPVLPGQISQLVSAISGYSENLENILPQEVFNRVLETVNQRAFNDRPSRTPEWGISEHVIKIGSIQDTAQILSQVFTALQDTEVKRITLSGCLGAIWLITFFVWLVPDRTDYFIKDESMLRNSDAKLAIYLRNGEWEINLWRSEAEPSKLLLWGDLNERRLRPPQSLYNYYPIRSAKQIITSTLGKDKSELIEPIGCLAGALLDLAASRGSFTSKSQFGLRQQVKLLDICSEKFLNSYPNTMEAFGWTCNQEFHKTKSKINTALQETFKGRRGFQQDLEGTNDMDIIKTVIVDCYAGYYDTKDRELMIAANEDALVDSVIDPAVHLATEGLLGCFSSGNIQNLCYRPHEEHRLKKNAQILRSMLFLNPITTCSYSDFRAEAIMASIPGIPEVQPNDLAIVAEGYVVYSAILESVTGIMTDQRVASEIRIVPGSLRLTDGKGNPSPEDKSSFEKLVEDKRDNPMLGRLLCENPIPLQGFDGEGSFCGFQMRQDQNSTRIDHLVTNTFKRDKRLLLATYLRSRTATKIGTTLIHSSQLNDSLMWSPHIPVSWEESMEAIVFAKHITDYTILPEQMRRLARHWKDKGYLGENRLVWTPAGHVVTAGVNVSNQFPRRYVSMTASNEQLRFFEAGYLGRERYLYIRHAPPLEQCLKEAYEDIESKPNWAIIT